MRRSLPVEGLTWEWLVERIRTFAFGPTFMMTSRWNPEFEVRSPNHPDDGELLFVVSLTRKCDSGCPIPAIGFTRFPLPVRFRPVVESEDS